MINPSDVIAEIITSIKALDSYDDLNLDDVIEINEKPSKNVKPPYVGIYFDYDEEAKERDSSGDILAIPVSIYVLIFSQSYQTAPECYKEVFDIMLGIRPGINGSFTVSGKVVTVKPKARPLEILAYSADQAILKMRYEYIEYFPFI